jgi:polysaccharide pyruvyl transferase WcaK-like protein
MLQIGLLGIAYDTGNKGCEALAYSFFEVLNKIAISMNETIEVDLLTTFPTRRWIKEKFSIKKTIKYYQPKESYSNLAFSAAYYIRKGNNIIFSKKARHLLCVFDFTDGDSFTDIYGQTRFYQRTQLKKHIIDAGIPLVLGSQTIGPFRDENVREFAKEVIKKSYEVFVRDEKSYKCVMDLSERKPVLTTDVAFFLPYNKTEDSYSDAFKVGFNPSGLLWSGGYSRDNQFHLTVDYQNYCKSTIKALLENGYDVHLILHAFNDELSNADNDLVAALKLNKLFPKTKISPKFYTPMEAKSYISNMDVFIGARMHATIAALSAGVPVIPFSYSRKFEGLFQSLDYEYVIGGTKMSTEESIIRTLDWITDVDKLSISVQKCQENIDVKNVCLLEEYSNLLSDLNKHRGKEIKK